MMDILHSCLATISESHVLQIGYINVSYWFLNVAETIGHFFEKRLSAHEGFSPGSVGV